MNITPEMMQRFQNMRNGGQGGAGNQGAPGAQDQASQGKTGTQSGQTRVRDTAAMRQFRMRMQQQGGEPGQMRQGGMRDTTRRRIVQTPAAERNN
jgi:hypothetical protein